MQCGRHVPNEHAASIFGTENAEVTGLSDTWVPTYQTTRRQYQYYVVLRCTAAKTLNYTREMFHTHTHIHTRARDMELKVIFLISCTPISFLRRDTSLK